MNVWIIEAESFSTTGRIMRAAGDQKRADEVAAELCNAVLDEWPDGALIDKPEPATPDNWPAVAQAICDATDWTAAYVQTQTVELESLT